MNLKHVARLPFAISLCLSVAMPTMAWAGGLAHEHGTAEVDLFIDNTTVSVQISSPLVHLVGFEHSPRTPDQRQKTDALIAELNMPLTLVNIDPAGGCQFSRASTSAKVLGDKTPAPSRAQDAHSNLKASLEYKCKSAARIEYVNLPLITRFTGLERVHVQVVTLKVQGGQTLVKPAQRVTIPR